MPNENRKVSALICPRTGHTTEELLQILKEKEGVSVREIVPGVLTFDGLESDLEAVRAIANVEINVDSQLYPDFF